MVSQRELDHRLIDRINAEEDRRERTHRILGNIALAAAGILTAAVLALAAPVDVQAGEWESLGSWKCTAYCPLECCNGRGRAWKTASGIPMEVGDTVATAKLPFGTKLLIDGHVYTVTDRGVPYGTVDILHESHSAANKFGIKHKQVFIWRD